jgi:agmatine/peptidylarginine deiminase
MTDQIRIPADFEPHTRTIMAWAVHREWGCDRERVERELETTVRAIAEDEPVTLLTPPDLVAAARRAASAPRSGSCPRLSMTSGCATLRRCSPSAAATP